MANISKIKLPSNVTYDIKDSTAITNITRSGTTFTATRQNGTTFTFTQQDNNTTYSAGTNLSLSGTQFSTVEIPTFKSVEVTNFIDFHGGSTTNDYGCRIAASGTDKASLYVQSDVTTGYGSILAGGRAHLYTDAEGGNLTLTSKSGYVTEMDRYNDTNVRIYSYDSGGTYHAVTWTADKDHNLDVIAYQQLDICRVQLYEAGKYTAWTDTGDCDKSLVVSVDYFPIGVVGNVQNGAGTANMYFTEAHLNNRAAGSCTLHYRIRSSETVSQADIYVDLLVAKCK